MPASGSAVVCLEFTAFWHLHELLLLGWVKNDLGKEEDVLVAAHVTVSRFWPLWKNLLKTEEMYFI